MMSLHQKSELAADAISVDVVIVAYGEADRTTKLISSLNAMSHVGRVVVVDNGDGMAATEAEMLGATAISMPHNPGFGTAQNAGVRLTDSEYVLILNPDAEMHPLSLEQGVRELRRYPRVAAVQGIIRNEETGSVERSSGGRVRWFHILGRAVNGKRVAGTRIVSYLLEKIPSFSDWVERVPESDRYVEVLSATALLIRRCSFLEVNGFDPEFFLYGEDIDLSLRLGNSGWKLRTLSSEWAVHNDGSTADSNWERELSWFEGATLYAVKWFTTPELVGVLLANMIMVVRLAAERPIGLSLAVRKLITCPILRRSRR